MFMSGAVLEIDGEVQDAGRQEQGYGQEDGAAPNRVVAVETGVANFYTDS